MEQTKRCTQCGEEKALTEFYRHKKGRLGTTEKCKQCVKRIQKIHYEQNREKIIKRTRVYKEQNALAVGERARQYRAENREKLNKHERKRLRTDAVFKRRRKNRTELWRLIKNAKSNKNRDSYLTEHIGLSPIDLWEYLLGTWKTHYGEVWRGHSYHIDHITPCCSAETIEELDRLFYYKNLRLLTPEDNIEKKKQDLAFVRKST